MQLHVQKWGNSLALRIPQVYAKELMLKQDDVIQLSLVEGRLIIEPVRTPALTLEQLLEGITDENLHHEIETGQPVGQEAW
jgi:antitoxin MazE